MGLHTGNVLGYETRNKQCFQCGLGFSSETHDCRKNWSGSSKAMEADVAKSLIVDNKSMIELGVRVAVLIGDDDSSTISAVRNAIDTPITKWSDINHATASFSKSLFKLQPKHKKLTNRVIKHFKHLFACAIRFNKNEAAKVAKELRNIMDHVFGNHFNCTSWCKYNEDAINYKYKGLPYGRPLFGEEMKKDLLILFNRLADKADQLAPAGSSQRNESLHAMGTHRICKARHYGGSEALDYLVAATVASKNLGCAYVADVKEKLSMSPGRHTVAYKSQMQCNRQKQYERSQTSEIKRRRLFKKNEKKQSTQNKEQREGISYQSGMGLYSTPVPNILVAMKIPEDCVPIIFDIETTGLGMTAGICQLAAKVSGENESFMRYILPDRGFSFHASQINGFSISNGILMAHKAPVKTTPLHTVYTEFIQFLKKANASVVLLGHHAHKFDTRLVLRDVQMLGLLDEFAGVVKGFGDTLPMLKKLFPKRISYKLSVIVSAELGESATVGIHDALRDCEVLDEVLQKAIEQNLLTKEHIVKCCIDINSCVQKENNNLEVSKFRLLLEPLRPHISEAMLTKMAKSQLTMEILTDTYCLSSAEGIKILLGESVNGKARVTRSKRIQDSIISYLASINM